MRQEINSISDLAQGPPAVGNVPVYSTNGWRNDLSHAFDIRTFGALDDGITDCSAAVIAALDAADAAGGGIVDVPPGDFLCNTLQSVTGFATILDLRHDNLWLRGHGPASRLFSTVAGTRFLLINGNCKQSAFSDYFTNDYQEQPIYAMNPVTAGDRTITLVTLADASHFAVGDFVYLRSGQLTGASQHGEPDAEINRLVAVDTGTGVLTLETAALKDYVQEYYLSGTTGLTTRAVTANLAPFGISNVQAMTIENVKVSDLTIDMTDQSAFAIIAGGQCWGLTIENCILTGTDVTLALGDYRHAIIANNKHFCTRGAITTPSAGISAKGSADILCTGNLTTSPTYPINWQANEGTANLTFRDNTTISGPGSASTANPFSATGRPRNLMVLDNLFINGGTGAVISIQPGSDPAATGIGGIVARNIMVGKTFSTGVGIAAPGFILKDNRVLPAAPISLYESVSYAFGTGVPTEKVILWGWLTSVTQQITLGRLPVAAYPTAVYLQVSTAFDSDGTDQIEIGISGTLNLFMALTDVSTTGVKTVTAATVGYRTSAFTVLATYVNGGSVPLHGRALVGLEYAMAPQLPAEGA